MKLLNLIIISLLSLTLSGCMYISTVHFEGISVDATGKTNYPNITSADKQKIKELTNAITKLSPTVDKQEAYFVAYESVLYPKVLANEWGLMTPPNYHNQLVNSGRRQKGLCFHWARALMAHLDKPYKTLTLQRAMAFQGKYLEHNVPTIRAKGQDFNEGIILDAWRESSNLLWMKLKNDAAFPWIPYVPPKRK